MTILRLSRNIDLLALSIIPLDVHFTSYLILSRGDAHAPRKRKTDGGRFVVLDLVHTPSIRKIYVQSILKTFERPAPEERKKIKSQTVSPRHLMRLKAASG
jgi:hypothetical protein